jgi:hypothetical protein
MMAQGQLKELSFDSVGTRITGNAQDVVGVVFADPKAIVRSGSLLSPSMMMIVVAMVLLMMVRRRELPTGMA